MSARRTAFLLTLGIALLCLGCTSDDAPPTAVRQDLVVPEQSSETAVSWSTFYPLALGTHWHSVRNWSGRFGGDGPPPWPDETGVDEWDDDQICMEQRGATRYFVERRHWFNAEGDSGSEHIRYRQDSTGLYEAAVCLCEAPNCIPSASESRIVYRDPSDVVWERIAPRYRDPLRRAEAKRAWDRHFAKLAAIRGVADPSSGGVASGVAELTRLKYPLFPGQTWFIRPEPSFQAIVEAKEILDLPVGSIQAYRVRIIQPADPSEVIDVFQWWGLCGLVRFSVHSEGEIPDENGNPLPFTWDEDKKVTAIDLVGLRACSFVRE